MREIKFRVRDNGWIYMNQSEGYFLLDKADPEYINQYTGLKDKNGNEIYEGDIVRFTTNWNIKHEGESKKHEVIFRDGMFGIKDSQSGSMIKLSGWASFEVIGNIYENPELLNG